jgi:5-methylcytosine-specific restriction protein A
MTPTIRIDDEVYSWLQNNARPFEDTPNTVLRRIAGLDRGKDSQQMEGNNHAEATQKGRDTEDSLMRVRAQGAGRGRIGLDGKQLNDEWGVGARHALFSRDGNWYENLERFPGALFDLNGYVLFKTEQEYRKCPQIHIGKKTNVRGGISSIPGYVRKN